MRRRNVIGMRDLGLWEYNPHDGLYYFEGFGVGRTLREVEQFEDNVELHEERKLRRLAERSEY